MSLYLVGPDGGMLVPKLDRADTADADFLDWLAAALAPPERACRACGCTEFNACWPPCSWVAADLCSACR